jgi:hypothetical protein
VYAGDGPTLVAYDPVARGTMVLGTIGGPGECSIRALAVGTDGRIYGGCGLHLFSYAPDNPQLENLGQVGSYAISQITALVTGADGRLYGSIDDGYGSDAPLFMYGPILERVDVLGLSVR